MTKVYWVARGKDYILNTDRYEVDSGEDSMTIRLSDSLTTGAGTRGGIQKVTNYHAAVILSPIDVQNILAVAIRNKMIVPPGLGDVIAAQDAIKTAISKMK